MGVVVGTFEVLVAVSTGALKRDVEENEEPDAGAPGMATDCCPNTDLEMEGIAAEEGVTPKSEEAVEES